MRQKLIMPKVKSQTATANIRQSNIESGKGHGKLITVLLLAGAAAGAIIGLAINPVAALCGLGIGALIGHSADPET